MTPSRLVLAHDDALVRTALAELLAREPDLDPVVECDGLVTLREALRTRTHLVLLADSLDSAPRYPVCGESAQSAPVLVLVHGRVESALLPALEAGAIGVLTTTATYEELVDAVRTALRGDASIPRGMLGSLLRDLIDRRRREDEGMSRYRRLSARERDVLAMLARGADVKEMAAKLVLSPQTIRSHVQHVLDKLEVHSRAEAVGFALEHDLVDRPPTWG
jgi:DNA-binding NarL/FixJ family response regulator